MTEKIFPLQQFLDDCELTRREVMKYGAILGGTAVAATFGVFGCSAKPDTGRDKAAEKSADRSLGELKMQLEENLKKTEQHLQKYPRAYKRLAGYIKEVRGRLETPPSAFWVEYQSNRLDRIRWLVIENDDGVKSGMRLRMRPYDIPWIIHALGARYENGHVFNGVVENWKKIEACPNLKIEFTKEYADFCYLCKDMTADGCTRHPEFGGYGKEFPQRKQISPELIKDSDLSLQMTGLKWTDVVTSKRLLDLCVEKAPDPSAFPVFPLPKGSWDGYRRGIERIKKSRA